MSDAARPRVLLAPVTITPTKPLTPTHLKYLLSLDVLYRATSQIADVTCVYHHQTFAVTQQTAEFWWFLDRACPDTDFSTFTEEQIGQLYVRHHAESPPVPYDELLPYLCRVEEEEWTHPASLRLLDIWERHYESLNLFDVKLGRQGPGRVSTTQVLDQLAARDLCLDGRALRASTYLDLTAHGLPLRTLIRPSGQANYLVCLLRELLPLVGMYDRIVLAHDRELNTDYRMIELVLTELGATVSRLEVTRVPIDGVVRSSRYGGWQGYTLDELSQRFTTDGAGAAGGGLSEFQLGLRLYLIAVLGKGSQESFRSDHLRRWLDRAADLMRSADEAPNDVDIRPFLRGLARQHGFVDPYRLTSTLLSRRRDAPPAAVLRTLYP